MSILFGITLTCSDVRCQRTEIEIKMTLACEYWIFLSNLFVWLYIIKRKFKCFLLNITYFTLKVKIIYVSFVFRHSCNINIFYFPLAIAMDEYN